MPAGLILSAMAQIRFGNLDADDAAANAGLILVDLVAEPTDQDQFLFRLRRKPAVNGLDVLRLVLEVNVHAEPPQRVFDVFEVERVGSRENAGAGQFRQGLKESVPKVFCEFGELPTKSVFLFCG